MNAQLFAALDLDWRIEIEDSLFPVSVLGERRSGHGERLRAARKVDVKMSGKSVNSIVMSSGQFKIAFKCLDFFLKKLFNEVRYVFFLKKRKIQPRQNTKENQQNKTKQNSF